MSNKRNDAKRHDDVGFSNDTETNRRRREVQFIINLIEPDPEYQPSFVSDEATLLDCLCMDEGKIQQRLQDYFGEDFDIDVRQPVWKLVDQLKVSYIEWLDRS